MTDILESIWGNSPTMGGKEARQYNIGGCGMTARQQKRKSLKRRNQKKYRKMCRK